jgi:hypothetical protein
MLLHSLFGFRGSGAEVNAIKIHLTGMSLCLASRNGALQSHSDLDVLLIIITGREMECLGQNDCIDLCGIVLELRVVTIKRLANAILIDIVDIGLKLARIHVGILLVINRLGQNDGAYIVIACQGIVHAEGKLPIRGSCGRENL